MEDPFFVVREEVQKTIEMASALFHRWCELANEYPGICKEEYDWTTNELRNCLRSIEWDLEDLEETISIVEKNSKKFKISASELNDRKLFIENTRSSVKEMREHMTSPKSKSNSRDKHNHQSQVLHNASGPDKPQSKYTRLQNEVDSIDDRILSTQRLQMGVDQIHVVNSSSGQNLNDNSPQPVNDQDEQTVMLDDSIHVLDSTDTRVGYVAKKVAKVLHLSRDWRQWTAISALLGIVGLVVMLFFLL